MGFDKYLLNDDIWNTLDFPLWPRTWVSFFCKGLHSKYIRLCGPHVVSVIHCLFEKNLQSIKNVKKKKGFNLRVILKQAMSWIRSVSHNLLILGLEYGQLLWLFNKSQKILISNFEDQVSILMYITSLLIVLFKASNLLY